jgi:hypothetical protein
VTSTQPEHVRDRLSEDGGTGLHYDPERDLYVDATGREPEWQAARRRTEESGWTRQRPTN